MKLSQFGRLLQINHVLGRHRLDELILAIHFFRPYRFLSWFSPYRWRHKADLPRGERIRLALQDLGPIFVKFGQILSTRRDLLPEDIADSLAKLQDQVAPFPNDVALALIHAAYEEGEPERIFSHIEAEPLASASIAQVHAATLTDGKQVILKLVRPGIEKVIRRDVDLLYTLAGLAEKYWSEGKRLRPREVVAELE
ncbi:MAG TPA: ubiquinone biosynthesis regulatory protein kinase UbiB, partial [Methylophaga sp.]|nr:ubiquinone biosynthesis regulatory protein kinase UbiB [Methylophaga sp.]